MIVINFFKTGLNNSPVEEFLDNLQSKQAQKITWVMKLIEELNRIPEQYFKKLTNTDDIWEIRAQTGSNVFRILGFFEDASNFIATNGFQKKTQKIPQKEIALAEKRRQEHMRLKKEVSNERLETIY